MACSPQRARGRARATVSADVVQPSRREKEGAAIARQVRHSGDAGRLLRNSSRAGIVIVAQAPAGDLMCRDGLGGPAPEACDR
jgi:hypothetical protein